MEYLEDSAGNPYWVIDATHALEMYVALADGATDSDVIRTLSFDYGSGDCRVLGASPTPPWACDERESANPDLPSPLIIHPHTPQGPMAVFVGADSPYTAVAPILDSALNLGSITLLGSDVELFEGVAPARVPLDAVYWTADHIEAEWLYTARSSDPCCVGAPFDVFAAFDENGNVTSEHVWPSRQLTQRWRASPFLQDGIQGLAVYRYQRIFTGSSYFYLSYVPADPLGGPGMPRPPILPDPTDTSGLSFGRSGSGALLARSYEAAPFCRHSSGDYFALPGSCIGKGGVVSTESGAIVLRAEADRVSLLRVDEQGYLTSPILEVARRAAGSAGTFTTNANSDSQAAALVWADSAEPGSWHWMLIDKASLGPLTPVFTETGNLPTVMPLYGDWVFVDGTQSRAFHCGPGAPN